MPADANSSSALLARLQHLNEASKLLVNASPVISAHLQNAKRAVAEEHHYDTREATATRTCGSCGQILIPGWTCTPSQDRPLKRSRKQRLDDRRETVVRLQCSLCYCENGLMLKKTKSKRVKGPNARSESLSIIEDPPRQSQEAAVSGIPPSNETAAPRRKARGKNATLQALLAAKRTEPKPAGGFQLGFADLLKG